MTNMYVSDDYGCVSSRSSKAPYATGLGDLSLFSVISQTTLHIARGRILCHHIHARSLLQVAVLNTHTTLTQTVELTALFFKCFSSLFCDPARVAQTRVPYAFGGGGAYTIS